MDNKPITKPEWIPQAYSDLPTDILAVPAILEDKKMRQVKDKPLNHGSKRGNYSLGRCLKRIKKPYNG
ncbi:hypothetical protein [Mucilaginibacter sp.]|uniref:hypothetical protein n=1 Tax=Mucilaginibacter sp. TaxID=1882438 RepID=UPI0035BC4AA8